MRVVQLVVAASHRNSLVHKGRHIQSVAKLPSSHVCHVGAEKQNATATGRYVRNVNQEKANVTMT
jgi:hypothetical protein